MRSSLNPLPRSFFARSTCTVARELLGCRLLRLFDGERLSGTIVETEAYVGEEDLACHARAGRTARTAIMYGAAGFSYVYFTYGMHWMLNAITEDEGFPAAVLIRGLEPGEGLEEMRKRRGIQDSHLLCSGPARLTQALNIQGEENGLDLCNKGSNIWIEACRKVPRSRIVATPRIGISSTPEPWRSIPWRYFVDGNPFVSRSLRDSLKRTTSSGAKQRASG